MLANLENSAMATVLEKVSFYSNPKERQCQRMFQLLHICTHFTWYQSNAQIFQVRFQQYMNHELPDVQAGFRKGRGTSDQIANILGTQKKRESSRKIPTSALVTMPKPLTLWTITNCGKSFRRWEYQTSWPVSWEMCMQVKKQQLEWDMEKQTSSKSRKEYVKAVEKNVCKSSLPTAGWKGQLPG